MARAGAVAGLAAGLEFAAWRGPPLVDAAGHLLAQLAGQSCAAWRRVVGAAHAGNGAGDVDCQPGRDRAAVVFQLIRGEVDAKAAAAGSAGQAGVGGGLSHGRQPAPVLARWVETVYKYSISS